MIWIGLLGALAWLAALGSWGYQAYGWLQHGYWEPLPLAGTDWNLGICFAVLGAILLILEEVFWDTG